VSVNKNSDNICGSLINVWHCGSNRDTSNKCEHDRKCATQWDYQKDQRLQRHC